MTYLPSVGLSQLKYSLPARRTSVRELAVAGQLHSRPETLTAFGFESAYIAQDDELNPALAKSVHDLLASAQLSPSEIPLLIVATGSPAPSPAQDTPEALEQFHFRSARLQHEIGAHEARALELVGQGCGTFVSALDLAARYLTTSDYSHALVVAADARPPGASRDVIHNLMSDAAAAVLVSRRSPMLRIRGFYQQSQPYYWETATKREEVLASYFPMTVRVITQALTAFNVPAEALRWIVPHNVGVRSWELVCRALKFPLDRVWLENVARVGHTVSCDHVINLVDMRSRGAIAAGDLLLLFTFGFGASWTAMLVEA
ncbi:hypothetical protein HY374_02490 [Candidatus Berkelbacteria bacterium]|nr:hypothetical protein [Candidatus Berkelbacteria bacterium]